MRTRSVRTQRAYCQYYLQDCVWADRHGLTTYQPPKACAADVCQQLPHILASVGTGPQQVTHCDSGSDAGNSKCQPTKHQYYSSQLLSKNPAAYQSCNVVGLATRFAYHQLLAPKSAGITGKMGPGHNADFEGRGWIESMMDV